MTPQEAATQVDYPNPARHKELHDFVLSASARDIQLFIHCIQSHGTKAEDWHGRARMALDIRLAEDAGKTAQTLVTGTEKLVQHSANLTAQTERLVCETFILRRFTKGVFWLTVVLAAFTAALIVIAYLEYSTKAH